jgi:hypothetical protein
MVQELIFMDANSNAHTHLSRCGLIFDEEITFHVMNIDILKLRVAF